MASLKDKIKAARLKVELTQQQVADSLNLTKSAISSYEKGKSNPSPEVLRKMGGLLKVDFSLVDKSNDSKIVYVPSAQAGYLSTYTQEQIEDLPRLSLDVLNLGPGMHAAFQVRGDSMYPLLKAGDFFIGRTFERKERLELGEVYALETRDEGIVIKRVVDESKTSLFLASDNRSTRPYEVLKEEIIRLHKYAAHIGFGSTKLLASSEIIEEIRQALKTIPTKA